MDIFDDHAFQSCWNWHVRLRRIILQTCWNGRWWRRHIPVRLKLTCLTAAHYSYGETDIFDDDTFQPCWNWGVWPQHITAMMKRTFLTTMHNSHAETDFVWRQHIFSMLWATFLTTTHYVLAETDVVDNQTLQLCFKWLLRPGHIPTLQKRTFLNVNILRPCWDWHFLLWHISVMLKWIHSWKLKV